MHTPTPPGGPGAAGAGGTGSSPATGLDGILGRARAGTLGAKSMPGSEQGGATPAAAGVLSGLGLGLGPAGTSGDAILEGLGLSTRGDGEAWNAQRTREVVEILGARWGRVSRENVERCMERIGGLECLWDEGVGTSRGGKGGGPSEAEIKRTFSIAGSEFMVDIEWVGERVSKVKVEFQGGAEEAATAAGEILRRDLVGSWKLDGQEKKAVGFVSLEPFLLNLSRLARIDSLGKGSVSCFSALEGVNSSLKKLWELEVRKGDENIGEGTTKNQRELNVTCEKSGRPATNSHNKIGLNIEYWVDRRIIAEKCQTQLASKTDSSSVSFSLGSLQHPYNLLIDCEAFDASQYPAIRISNNWLADTAWESLSNEEVPLWQDPPPTFVPNSETKTVDLGMSTGTLPNIRFIAKLNPPVTLPLAAAVEIFNHVGQPILHQPIQTTTFAALLFPEIAKKSEANRTSSKDSELQFDRVVQHFNADGKRSSHHIRFNFFSRPDSWARIIHEIPFSHPKQLIDILPYLRQWALFGNMLKRSFGVDGTGSTQPSISLPSANIEQGNFSIASINGVKLTTKKKMVGYRNHRYQPYDPPSDTDSDEENDLPASRIMKPPTPPPSVTETATSNTISPNSFTSVDVSFQYAPLPRRIDLDVSIALPPEAKTAPGSCLSTFRIQPNAKIEVEYNMPFDSDEVPKTGGKDGYKKGAFGTGMKAREVRERMGKALTVLEDLGGIVAWLEAARGKVSSGD